MRTLHTICSLILTTPATFSQLVINEVDYDQPSIDTHEFIELKNTGSSAFPMQYVMVVLVSGGGATPTVYRTIGSPAWAPLNPGAYFTICGDPSLTPFCDEDATPDQNLVENGTQDAIVLVNITDSTVIDALSYEGTLTGFTEGNGFQGEDPFYGGAGGNMENVSIGRWPDGNDTGDNATDFVVACATPGEPNEADTSSCAISTGSGTPPPDRSPLLSVFNDPASGTLWMRVEGMHAPVVFEIFRTDGRLLAAREIGSMGAPSWAWHHGGTEGAAVVRVRSGSGSLVHRVILR
jgi:hypothetical protein